jgi:hypothetical protein
VRVDETEGVNDHFAFHRLDGVNDNSNGPYVQGLE